MKNLTSKKLIIFGALAILFFSAGHAFAYTSNSMDFNSFYDGNSHYNNDYVPNNEPPISITLPNTPSTVRPAVSNVVASSNVKNTSATTVAPVSNSTANKNSNGVTPTSDVNSVSNVAPNSSSIDANNLTALSFQGSSGFMPSSIWQWILVVILILAIVIIARILGTRPAGNDPHAAHAH